MPNSIVLSKYEARDFILDQTLQTRHRHHRMDPKMRRSALSQSRAHTQCCFKNEKKSAQHMGLTSLATHATQKYY